MKTIEDTTVTAKSDFNYSSLQTPVSSREVKAFKDSHEKGARKKIGMVLAILFSLFFSVITLLLLVTAFSVSGDITARFGVLLWIALCAAIVAGVLHFMRQRYYTLVRLERFAQANQMEFAYNQRDPTFAGMFFDEGHSREVTECLKHKGQWEFGNYRYITGSGKNRTTHALGYAVIDLPRTLPHMVLDNKANNFLKRISNLPDTFQSNQTLALEGDFQNYFTLYAPAQYKTDALYVFTPDVMAAVIDNGGQYDMEVIDNKLFLYKSAQFDLTSPKEIATFVGIVDKIRTQLFTQATRYSDYRVGSHAVDIIAPAGTRLKSGISWISVLIFMFVIAYYLVDFYLQFMAG